MRLLPASFRVLIVGLVVAIGCARQQEAPVVVARDRPKAPEIEKPVQEAPPPKIDKPVPIEVKKEKPVAKALASPLDRLDRNEMTPILRENLPAEVVAVLAPQEHATTMGMAFTPDGKRLALARSKSSIEIWDLSASKPDRQAFFQMDANTGWALRVAFSNDGKWMATVHGSPGKTLLLWRLTDGDMRVVASQKLPRIDNVVFHPNSKIIVCGSITGNLFEITPKGLAPLPITLEGAQSWYTFADGGKTFYSVVFNQARNGPMYGSEVKFWKFANNQVEETRLIQHDRFVKALALSPDGKTLATATLDLKIRLWDLTAQPPVATAPFSMPNWVAGLYFTPDGARLIAVSSVSDVMLWNLRESKLERHWHIRPPGRPNDNVIFSASALAPDGRHLAIGTIAPGTIILRLPAAAKN